MKKMITAALLAGTCLAGAAQAVTPREAELQAHLEAVEAALAQIKTELAATRGAAQASDVKAEAAVAGAKAATDKVATWEAKAAKPADDGFKVGGTTVKINGFFKAVGSVSHYDDGSVANGTLLRDFFVPGQIPVGGVNEGNDFEGNAKQTRIWLTTATPVGTHMLKGHLEFDFQTAPGTQGSQRTTNGYNLALRRGFITYDNWLFGQEWTNFQYTAALPESTDFVGTTDGTVFVRQPQLRYTKKLSKLAIVSVSIENPETATATPSAATLVENADDRLPDVTARLNFTPKIGEFSVAALWRQLTVDSSSANKSVAGWGLSAAGKIPFGSKKQHGLHFMVTKGEGIGRYVGLNLAPDAIYVASGNLLDAPGVTAGFAAVRLMITPQLRTNIMGSFQDIDYHAGFVPTGATKSSWSAAANLFYSPVKPLDLGIEFRHGERELVSGTSGQFERLEVAAKYNF